jgi:hypothetical protein
MTSTAGYVYHPSQEATSATTERRKEFCSASEAYPKSNTKPFKKNKKTINCKHKNGSQKILHI